MIRLILQMTENAALKNLFLKLANMSISASWIVLVVLLLRVVLKKAPKWVNVLLWGIVAIRLICPFSFESALSLIPNTETIPMNIEMDATPAIDSGINAVNSVVNPIISASFTPHPGASANPLQIWIPLAAVIWFFGMVLMMLYTVISYWRLRRKVDTAVRYKDNIYQSENVSAPFVLGILNPRIYLPYSMDGKNLSHVVAHEQAHIRRKDHWWKPLGFLLLTVYWFNPLMWVAYIILCRDIELACDEKVIAKLGSEQRADYTQALVACSVNRRMIAACPLAFGEVGVKDRVKSIMNYRKPAFWILVISVITCVIVAVCFLTNPEDHEVALGISGSIESSKWKISLHIDDVTPKGATITLMQDGGFLVNRLFYGDDYNIEKFENNHWIAIEPLYDPVWATIAYSVPLNDSITWNVNWSNIFGELEPGIYRFCKSITDHRAPGATDHEVFTAEFLIPSAESDGKAMLLAKVIEIFDGHFLVEPVEGSLELSSASIIEVSMKNMKSSPEPQIGDLLEIEYDGQIMETYPARINNPYSIKVIEEAESRDLIPMVMVNGELYLDTGKESTVVARCGMMDGEIISQVDGSKAPTIDNQSNFGTGYGYQYGTIEGTIEIFMNEKWWIFATEEVRREIQFPQNSDGTSNKDILKIFSNSISGDNTIIVTDHVYADDSAYGLDGVVQYADETGSPWKLAFIRDGVVHPVGQNWGTDYIIASRLKYLGNGAVQVYVENKQNGDFYECIIIFAQDESGNTNFKSESKEVEVPKDTMELMTYPIVPVTVVDLITGEQKFVNSNPSIRVIQSLIASEWWAEGNPACDYDFKITVNEEDFLYHTDCGTFTAVSGDRCITLDETQQEAMDRLLSEANDVLDRYWLTIGADGVKSIEIKTAHSSGGCEHADGSLYQKGERIWVECLDGYRDLGGVSFSAVDEAGLVIWQASIPDGEDNEGFTHLRNDDWNITNIP